MNLRHVQSEDSFDRISDHILRKSIQQAILRAADIDWSFFVALRIGQGHVICFDAALPLRISTFLYGCSRYAIPRDPAPSAGGDSDFALPSQGCFVEIVDVELRGAMERAVARAKELNIFYFFDLWIESLGRTEKQLHFSCAGYPWAIAYHLHSCFRIAAVASLWNRERQSVGGQVGLEN